MSDNVGHMDIPDRRGAFSGAVLTLATFLAPALLAPGPIEAANLAGVVFAIWMAVDVWRRYGRRDVASSFAFRVAPVGPGVVAAAALLFAIALLHAWSVWEGAGTLAFEAVAREAARFWSFPFSPVRLYGETIADAPQPAPESVRLVTLTLSTAVVVGLIFCLFAFVARIIEPDTLRRHALIWKGVKIDDAARALAARGAKGLKPMRDPFSEVARTPVAGRVFLRAASLVVAVASLAYAPVFIRLIRGMDEPRIRAFFESDFMENVFFPLWITSLWGVFIAAAIIYIGAYLRLGFALARK